MPTLRRLTATELMSFSLIQDLNSLTAKAAETPAHTHIHTHTPNEKLCRGFPIRVPVLVEEQHWCQTDRLTLFDEVLIEEAVQDGG